MTTICTSDHDLTNNLPDFAPRIRVTIGAGTGWQESICLRRPVTLIGSDHPAHVRLSGPLVGRIHCAIVNTGSAVLLKDLHAPDGTFRNGERVSLAVLHDGDVVSVADAPIQIAIKRLDQIGTPSAEPAQTPAPNRPLRLSSADQSRNWTVADPCALVGSSPLAEISLNDPAVLPFHALIFGLGDNWMVYDLTGDSTCIVAGMPCDSTVLQPGVVLTIGQCNLTVGKTWPANSTEIHERESPTAATVQPKQANQCQDSLSEVERKLSALRQEIEDSWLRINGAATASIDRAPADVPPTIVMDRSATASNGTHPTSAESGSAPLNAPQSMSLDRITDAERDLVTREAELDRRDADLRGRLCDLNSLSDDLAERERELRTQRQNLATEAIRLQNRAQQLDQRELVLQAWQKQLETREKQVQEAEQMADATRTAAAPPNNGEYQFAPKPRGLFRRRTRI